jgi:hypothetical protein
MKQLILIAGLTIFASIANAQYNGYWNQPRQPQHYQYRDQYGMPQGSADWNQYDHSWQFRDQYGMPQGSSQWNQYDHSWQFRDQYGMPQGSVRP